jgi:phage terminase small subunit
MAQKSTKTAAKVAAKRTRKEAGVLSTQQEEFCQLYVTGGLTATGCAIKAGYSAKTARAQASQLLTRLNIQERIDQLRAEAQTVRTLTRKRIRELRASIAERGSHSEALTAMRDEEKAMGWQAPDKIDVTHDVTIKWGG